MIHLDTNVLIRALVPGTAADAALRRWLREDTVVQMSTLAWAEFLCGPTTPEIVEVASEVVGARLPVTDEHALLAADLFNQTGRRRGSLPDCLIAATAMLAGATLATTNVSDFAPMKARGLELHALRD